MQTGHTSGGQPGWQGTEAPGPSFGVLADGEVCSSDSGDPEMVEGLNDMLGPVAWCWAVRIVLSLAEAAAAAQENAGVHQHRAVAC